ncbi:MAG: hypothetical protein OZSIB_3255 [Candidatus Ozemobacter sibiricus]|jgi:hypothetical protein|uniref:Uncharacterized protein n=1 Tax=Candidatus Ozemobacter sibiricus TaxID=2268124 RepID=A0A367ZRY9_9BACT|nr:MAG: hypothetical protein OZSIB_3255 [Candidatus Ozemobacter sibiricus]
MAEEQSGAVFLIALLVTTLVVGAFVLIVKSDYRVEQIVITNEDYYPNVEVTTETD